jgi:hypothetical protein
VVRRWRPLEHAQAEPERGDLGEQRLALSAPAGLLPEPALRLPGATAVRNKPVARASTDLITFGRGPAARVAVVSVNKLSPCSDRAAIKQFASVYVCVMGVCLQLTAYAAWWSYMESVAIRQELQARPARWCASWGRPKLADRAAEWGSVSSCSRSVDLAIKTPCTHRCRRGEEKHIRQRVCAAAFGRNSCFGYCSSSSSVCCVRLSVQALLRANDRSHQEPTVDPNNRASSRSSQLDDDEEPVVARDGWTKVRPRGHGRSLGRWKEEVDRKKVATAVIIVEEEEAAAEARE